MENKTNTTEDVLRQDAIKCIEAGNLEDAKNTFNRMLLDNLYNDTIRTDLMYVDFWLARKAKFSEIDNHYTKGLYILKQWGTFLDFCRDRTEDRIVFFAIQTRIFTIALHEFSRYGSKTKVMDSSTLFNIGICYKILGKYDDAIVSLESANSRRQGDASTLSQLADCYDLENETRAAKIFFREAFYLDPQKVQLEFIQSQMVWNLVDKISGLGYSGEMLKEWIPVYGTADGVFNIRRDLKGLEIAQLKRDIISLEETVSQEDPAVELYVPRLINRYIWLIDFYTNLGSNSGIIDATLKKIRDLNPAIYELLIQTKF